MCDEDKIVEDDELHIWNHDDSHLTIVKTLCILLGVVLIAIAVLIRK